MQLISVIGKHSPPSRADGLAWPGSQMDRYAQNNVCSAARLVPCRLLRCCSSARIPFIRPRVQQEDSFIHDLDPGQPVGLARTDFVELRGLWPVSAEYLYWTSRQPSGIEHNPRTYRLWYLSFAIFRYFGCVVRWSLFVAVHCRRQDALAMLVVLIVNRFNGVYCSMLN